MSNNQNIFSMSVTELAKIAKDQGIPGYSNSQKNELILKILEKKSVEDEGLSYFTGVLDVVDEGYGFLRIPENSYKQSSNDVYVSQTQIKKFNLKKGNIISGPVRPPKEKENYLALLRIDAVNFEDPGNVKNVSDFEYLTPCYPTEKLNLETDRKNVSTRVINLFTPIGKGQRGLIVAPPRTGKTVLLQNIANAILTNHPEVYVIVLLVDERPEEVTEMKNTLLDKNREIVSSTFDETSQSHIEVAEMVINKAKRIVEVGQDVVILLDSLTRLARAYNNVSPSSGKVLSGGIDSNALHRPKKFFGSARNTVEKGSLTIMATALVDTGSRMDQVIFEEFKGTGNMELVLDRNISDMRLYPAVDLIKSGTRREELLLTQNEINRMFVLRNYLKSLSPAQGIEKIREHMLNSKSNDDFLGNLNK